MLHAPLLSCVHAARRAVLALLGGLFGLLVSMIQAQAAPPAPVDAHGLHVIDWQPLLNTPRLWNAVVSTDALPESVHVTVYLPADYESQPRRRYPVLYLLHGHGEPVDHTLPWVVTGQAPAVVDASPFQGIVVIPQCGRACWYTDWVRPARNGYRPQWETYYIQQLLPWIDANFRTQGTREGRAIAGLSMGGYGALAMSARFPHLFGHVGSFSGGSNIQDMAMQQVVIANTVTLLTGVAFTSDQKGWSWMARDVQDVFGSYASDNWRSRNPYALADVYGRERIRLAIYAGGAAGTFDVLEMNIGPHNDRFHAKLNASGSPHRYCRGRTGTHSYTYWSQDLADFLAFVAGQTPATCPNGWGAPQP